MECSFAIDYYYFRFSDQSAKRAKKRSRKKDHTSVPVREEFLACWSREHWAIEKISTERGDGVASEGATRKRKNLFRSYWNACYAGNGGF